MAKIQLKRYEFPCAVRGFQVYGKHWSPSVDEELTCLHERNNAFDAFAIKTVNENLETCGHLPREISRATKFLLDRGAVVKATITSHKYRRSPLVQGGLEIPCTILATLPGSHVNGKIIQRFQEITTKVYKEPENPVYVGSFIETEPEDILPPVVKKQKKKKAEQSHTATTATARTTRDIRSIFNDIKKEKEANAVIEID